MYGYDPLAEIRGALTTATNTTGGDSRTGVGGVEIQKLTDALIIDALNRGTDVRQRVRRRPMSQLIFQWDIRTDLGSTGKAVFQSSEGGTGTPYGSTKIQLYAPAKSYRADYEVSNMHIAASSSFYDALGDEARDAIDALKLLEEKSIICGSATSAYGFANAFTGLLQCMDSYVTFGTTDTIFGLARATGKTYLDVSLVAANATASAAFSMELLNSAITKSKKADGNEGVNKIFLCSEERVDEISENLRTHQRMPGTSIESPMGFRATAWRGIPIVGSRFMDKNGITSTGSNRTLSYADNAMYLLCMDDIEMRILNGVDFAHVPLIGSDSGIRYDVQGGFFKTYGVFIMRRFDNQVLIYNLAAP